MTRLDATTKRTPLVLDGPTAWVLLCAYLNCAGWTLSAVHHLHAGGYGVALAAAAAGLFGACKMRWVELPAPPSWGRWRRRLRRVFPAGFVLLALLTLLGGWCYAPSNYDALAYRLPRVLHWLAAEQWHWIHTTFPRLNVRAAGVEWLTAPLLALTRSDRPLFLISWISFLLLPGLIFSFFRQVGVRARVAWHWMWLTPAGICYVTQAGSIGNDLFAAPFALIAVTSALRARSTGEVRLLWLSVLAAALLSGAKSSNLPLGLPWLVAAIPALALLRQRPWASGAVLAIALLSSFVPVAALNHIYARDWTGLKPENYNPPSAAIRIATNSLFVVQSNLLPPVFPGAQPWNAAAEKLLPPAMPANVRSAFMTAELQLEEQAGIGVGLIALVMASLCGRASAGDLRASPRSLDALKWAVVLAFLAYLWAAPPTGSTSRFLAPYFPLLLPWFLRGGGAEVALRQRLWRGLAGLTLAAGMGMVIITPARPLWPVRAALAAAEARWPGRALVERARRVHEVYAARPWAFAPAVAALPPATRVIGFLSYDDPETSLWKPFGTRRVLHVLPQESSAEMRARGVSAFLVEASTFEERFARPLADWLAAERATLGARIPLELHARRPAQEWLLILLPHAPTAFPPVAQRHRCIASECSLPSAASPPT